MSALSRWAVLLVLVLVGGCAGPSPSASQAWPSPPLAPQGWASIGGMSGDQSSGTIVAVFAFRQGVVAVDAVCAGGGTVAVIVGWPADSGAPAATVSPTALAACGGDLADPTASRVELPAVPASSFMVTAFMVPSANTTITATFSVSLEQQI